MRRTRCTRLEIFLKNGYIYITDFMFQNLAKFGGGVNLTPPPGNPRIGQHPDKGGVKRNMSLMSSKILLPLKLSKFNQIRN